MGLVKRHMEEIVARGWADADSTVCSDCVLDEALVRAVVEYGATDACSFCGASAPVASAPLEVVLELVVAGVRFEYEDPIEQSAYDSEDGYLVPTWDTWDLLEELEVTERAEVLEAIAGAMRQGLWCQRNPYAAPPTESLVRGWQAFRAFAKESRRYTFLVPDPGGQAAQSGQIYWTDDTVITDALYIENFRIGGDNVHGNRLAFDATVLTGTRAAWG